MTLKWKKNSDGSLTLPKGEYYIGDLCYVDCLSKVWDDFCFEMNKNEHSSVGGIEFFASGTAYGDGFYTGSDGVEYAVDSGLIGIISAKHLTASDRAEEYIHTTKFDKPFTVSAINGIFHFGHITIDTLTDDDELNF